MNSTLAIADFDEALRLEPSHVDARRCRGDCHFDSTANTIWQLPITTKLSELDPEHIPSYFGRGKAYRHEARFRQGYRRLRRYSIRDCARQFAASTGSVVTSHAARGEFALAIADFDVALSFNSRDEVAFRGSGNAFLFSGNFDAALADFNAAVEFGPNSAVARHGRDVVREVMGDARRSSRRLSTGQRSWVMRISSEWK